MVWNLYIGHNKYSWLIVSVRIVISVQPYNKHIDFQTCKTMRVFIGY